MKWAWRRIAPAPLACALFLPEACTSERPQQKEEARPVVAATTATVPPVLVTGTPVEQFADAAAIDGKPPYEQALAYEANGRYWLARLVLERKALGADGTRAELALLANLCHRQGDTDCVESCSKRLGKKLKFDGSVTRVPFDAGEHREPTSDLARARDYHLRHQSQEARAILEPKVLDGKASKEEIRLLKSVCKAEKDRMCVALCNTKLK